MMTDPRPSDSGVPLLPCPFCGSEPTVARWQGESLYSHATVEYMQIRCDGCCDGAAIERHDEAIAAWNRRAALPVVPSDERLTDEQIMELVNAFTWFNGSHAITDYIGLARALLAAASEPTERKVMEQALEAMKPFAQLSAKRCEAYKKRGGDLSTFNDSHPAYDISAIEFRLGTWRAIDAAIAALRTALEK
jgi:Lar family restriction alleviation protein